MLKHAPDTAPASACHKRRRSADRTYMGHPSPERRSRLTSDKSPVRESMRRGKRQVESLSQTGEAGRGASGSTVLPEGESLKGQEHGGEAGVRANMPDPTPRKTRAIGSRMDCLNPSHQRWTSTSRATACQGAVGRIGRFHFRRPKLPLPSDGQRGRSRGRTGDLRRAITFDSHGHGIAFGSRGPWRRSGRSSPRAGKPSTWRRTAGALTTKAGR